MDPRGINVWNARTTGDFPSTGELHAICQAIKTFYIDVALRFPLGWQATFAGVAKEIGGEDGEDRSASSWTVDGEGAASTLPPATQLRVALYSSSGGRSGKGSKFFGPLVTDCLQADGTPTSAVLTDFNDAMDTLVGFSTGYANGAIGIWSRSDQVLRDLVGFSIADKFAVLRSRRD